MCRYNTFSKIGEIGPSWGKDKKYPGEEGRFKGTNPFYSGTWQNIYQVIEYISKIKTRKKRGFFTGWKACAPKFLAV
jgi:hypothetical protein